jgi:hypothetical protein
VGRVVNKKEEGGADKRKTDLTDTEDDDDFRDATAKPISSISNPLLPQDLRETRLKDRAMAVKKPPLHRGYAYAFAVIAGTSGALQQVWGLVCAGVGWGGGIIVKKVEWEFACDLSMTASCELVLLLE